MIGGMELRAPLDPQASAERMLRGAFLELQEAERIIARLEREAPNPALGARLVAIRAALAQLQTVMTPLADLIPRVG
jgi:hypothetical protein